MSKRKINQRQAKRIHAIQAKRQARLSEQTQLYIDESGLSPEQEGLLVTRHGKQLQVESGNGELFQCHSRQNLYDLVVGDRVVWQAGANHTGVIVACLPRRSLLARATAKQAAFKPIAANVEQLLLVIAPEPLPTTLLIDSYLVAAHAANIPLVLVVNKIDLLKEQPLELTQLLTSYQTLGYTVAKTSALNEQGLSELKTILQNKISVLVGQSGVGKSSLIANLLPTEAVAVGSLAGNTKLGAHTTSAARLYHLSFGGAIIDSPGIREFGLGELTAEQLMQGFTEFRPWLGQCRFHNCKHLQEPDCALHMAVENGHLSQTRLDNYRRLLTKMQA
jgi:ribosome biogenesis GTPase